MPLRPSRRIPKRLQRRPSREYKKLARKLFTKKRSKGLSFSSRFLRRWKRFGQYLPQAARTVRIWILWVIAAALIVVAVFFVFSPYLTVRSIRVQREDARTDIQQIQQVLKTFFGRHILFLSPQLIEKAVLDAIPESREVHVEKRIPDELVVTVRMEDIVAEAYVGDPDATEAGFSVPEEPDGHAYVSVSGLFLSYPFVVTPPERRRLLTIHLVDWAVKPMHSQLIISPDAVRDIQSAVSILEGSFAHTVSHVTYYVRAREYHVQTERLVLWFDLASTVVEQVDRYRMFLQTHDVADVQQYIDLRLQDRIVYR